MVVFIDTFCMWWLTSRQLYLSSFSQQPPSTCKYFHRQSSFISYYTGIAIGTFRCLALTFVPADVTFPLEYTKPLELIRYRLDRSQTYLRNVWYMANKSAYSCVNKHVSPLELCYGIWCVNGSLLHCWVQSIRIQFTVSVYNVIPCELQLFWRPSKKAHILRHTNYSYS